jgi:hypothetical protein
MLLTHLTQTHLELLERCPRRFQYACLDHLTAPVDPTVLERQEWGNRFHLVLQQYQLGLPPQPLLAHQPDLQAAVDGLMAAAPDLFPTLDGGPVGTLSEHQRSWFEQGYGFMVVYDLLRITPTQAEIIDWKTYQRPPSLAQLRRHWQTRLYCYGLVATTDWQPGQITMTYWFVPPGATAQGGQPRCLTIPYTLADHQRTRTDLYRLCDRLTTLQAQTSDFPQVAPDTGECQRCPFAWRCQRQAQEETWSLTAIADIPEVSLASDPA